jgi:ubiquinone/menaquinone biosynthesis C-methylase UbiE
MRCSAPYSAPATEVMLDLARIGVGSQVLDVAAGAGEPAITAAGLVSADLLCTPVYAAHA